ncbi:MAG: cmk [Frankiales bacterium]|nr:cmk [Frankiales bacterium]
MSQGVVTVSETPMDGARIRDPRSAGAAPTGLPTGSSPSGQPGADDLVSPDDLVRVVALDGPAGTGKSSVSRRVAAQLGWRFVDTGATYRAVTLAVLRAGVDPADARRVVEVARAARVELVTDPGAPGVRLDGADVSAEIRTAEVTANVSAVSAVPEVRTVLIGLQRQAMGTGGAVVEGRDIATVVAPRAAVKVYLDARPEVRARRRATEVTVAAHTASAEATAAVGRDLVRRDSLDNQTNRLTASDGAVHLDTSDLTLEEVVQAIVRLVREAGMVTT